MYFKQKHRAPCMVMSGTVTVTMLYSNRMLFREGLGRHEFLNPSLALTKSFSSVRVSPKSI